MKKPDEDDDLAREIRAHLELDTEERMADGASPDAARTAARRAFGNVTRIREDARAVGRPVWVEQAAQDLRYAIRSFARARAFTIVALITIALGIGATSAIFTVVNAVLLRPLPFPDSDRLVRLFEDLPASGPADVPRRVPALTTAEISMFRSQSRTIADVGASIPTIRTLTGRDDPVRLIGARVTPSLLSTIGSNPALGRLFVDRDDSNGAEPVVILSHATWQRYFGGDLTVLGQRAILDGTPHTIIGVMKREFAFPDPRDEFWMPLPRTSPLARQPLPLTARLRPGATPAAAAAELNTLVPRLRGAPAVATDGSTAGASRFAVTRLRDVVVTPVAQPLVILTVTVGVVLLIACGNVASLLLARGASRRRELAMRLALGASRARLIRQALTESVALALAGGAVGAGLAFGGVHLLRALAATLARRDLPAGVSFPRLEEVSIDGAMLGFTFAISVATGLLFGVWPAFRQARLHSIDALRPSGSEPAEFRGLRGGSAQGLLVVAEIAMATTLFVGGALLMRSFINLSSVSPGYDPRNVLTFQVALPPDRPSRDLMRLAPEVVERIQALPGVQAAGYAESLPMTHVSRRFTRLSTTPLPPAPVGPPRVPATPDQPDTQLVSREFLTAMGVPFVSGRTFAAGDGAGKPKVLLINRTLAASGALGGTPIGQHVYALGNEPWQVVGIVEDVKQSGLADAPVPQIFIDYRQVGDDEEMAGIGLSFSVRSEPGHAPDISTLRSIIRTVDTSLLIENIAPMDRLVAASVSRPRFYAVFLGIFAAVAVALSATGIYALVAFSVAQRTREIGIRMALGASRRRVVGLLLGQSLAFSIAGVLVGLAVAAALTRYLRQLLFGLTPLDVETFVAVTVAFGTVAALAALIPARRAATVDPMVSLRFD
jgi:putative ABC transport system permease protein